MQSTYTVKDPSGQVHQVSGEPETLTLQDALGQVGKTGGSTWMKGQTRLRYNGREFGETDLAKSFRDLNIQPGSTIEVIGS